MPFDAMVVSATVLVIFLAFAGVLLWGDMRNAARSAEGRVAISKAWELLKAPAGKPGCRAWHGDERP